MANNAKAIEERTISPIVLRRMLIAGGKMLEINKETIDALNVFPVPDGDTGTNMSLTMMASVKEICSSPTGTMDVLADRMSKGALRGARGNSGVILSQLIKGIANVIADYELITAKILAKAIQTGVDIAYSAVAKPKEGTMLTVARVIAEQAAVLCRKQMSMEDFLRQLIVIGEEILNKTPDMLDVLKKAGVVDSGGYGIVVIFRGFLAGYLGEEIGDMSSDTSTASIQPKKIEQHIDFSQLGEIEFAYCTEFFIINLFKKTTEADIDKLREKLNAIGDSTLVIGDLTMVKVHVHTNKCGQALTHALELGEVDKIKIENMLEQNRELKARYEAERKPIGLLSICAGAGFNAIFKDLAVDQVIEGGQTMNPSADDIAQAINRINAENVIVLPNNKNIVLAAEQSRALVQNKQVFVVPTKNIPQGLAATLAFDPESSVQDNLTNMNDAIPSVKTGSVTYAVRSSKMDGVEFSEGDIIGLDNSRIVNKGANAEEVTCELISKMKESQHEMLTLYYGQDVERELAEQFAERLREEFSECEVDMHFGGQPLYYYIFSLE